MFINTDVIATTNSFIKECSMCELCANGKALPFVGKSPKFAILGEAPGKDEVDNGTPFVGKSGEYLFKVFGDLGFNRDDFIIVNTTQCRPIKKVKGRVSNGKPNKNSINCCMPFVSSILFGTGVYDVIGLGNYPKYWIGSYSGLNKPTLTGISNVVGDSVVVKSPNTPSELRFTYCFHPASVIYDSKKKDKFEDVLEQFVNQPPF